MPDAAALAMQPDVLTATPPALSATSDAPDIKPAPALSATEPGQVEPPKPQVVRDEKTGRFKTVDNSQETDEPAPVSASAESEPAGGGKEPGEGAGPDTKPEGRKSDPAVDAAFARRDAEIAALRAQVAQLAAPKPEPPAPKPSYDAYESPEAYETALTAWAKAEGAREATVKAQENQVKAARAAEAKAIADTWSQRQTAWRAEHPDYDKVTGPDADGRPLNIPMHVAVPIAQLENGPQVEHWLGENRAEAERIAALVPVMAITEIGKLSAKLALEAVRPAPKPKPKPIEPVGSRSAPETKSLNEMTTDEYAEHMRSSGRLRYGPRRA